MAVMYKQAPMGRREQSRGEGTRFSNWFCFIYILSSFVPHPHRRAYLRVWKSKSVPVICEICP